MFNGPQISFPRFLRRIFLFKRFGGKYSSEGEACFCVHGRSAPAQRHENTVTIKLDPLKLSIRYKLFIFEIRISRFIQSEQKYLVTWKFLRTKFLEFHKLRWKSLEVTRGHKPYKIQPTLSCIISKERFGLFCTLNLNNGIKL